MKNLSRSTALKIAAVISFLLGATNSLGSLTFVTQGAAAVNRSPAGPPYFVEMILFISGIVGIVAAFGTWKQMRWGIVLTILAGLFNVLSAAPGILFAPRPWGFIASTVVVVLSIIIIVLCLWRDRQPVAA